MLNSQLNPQGALRDTLIKFFQQELQLKLQPDESDYILGHRFESFCVAFNKFSERSTDINRKRLLKIADAAVRHCAVRK